MTLEEAKSLKRNEIDQNTEYLIMNSNLTFDGNNFSMSIHAQINWLGIPNIPDNYFPINIKNKNNYLYSLTAQNKMPFFLNAVGLKNSYLQSGNDLIIQVDALTTVEEVLNFIDPRV